MQGFRQISQEDQALLEYSKQLIRSSSSVAADYIEANESLSRKDYFHRVRICRKECKESILWFKLCDRDDPECSILKQEAFELMRIFGAILEKKVNFESEHYLEFRV